MNIATDLYRPSLALLADLYQLTMAYGYWKCGRAEDEAVFHLFFRCNPFKGGYAVSAGLAYALDYLESLAFDDEDIAFLRTLTGNDGTRLFDDEFLVYLRSLRLKLDVDAIPEGTVVFPQEPLVRVRGPLILCQLVETALLNTVNFQTLIATKAARIVEAARHEPVLEFGLRRAQGIDGALAAARAAYIGGCSATSNVLAARLLGIPVRGTHAHSWVMIFEDEPAAFQAYADAMPNNCVFLVDTYDTIEGVKNAIAVGRRLRESGHEMVGIRLDSGDLACLSIEARTLLDEAGFADAAIVASNDLDENLIASLKEQGARIGVWGVGTKLVTAYAQPALGGVYKLAAIRRPGEEWQYRIKLSEQPIKMSVPGILQVRRFNGVNGPVADMIYDELQGAPQVPVIVDTLTPDRRKKISGETEWEDLLVPAMRDGRRIYEAPGLSDVRQRTLDQLRAVHWSVRRLVNPHTYPCGLGEGLFELRARMARELAHREDR